MNEFEKSLKVDKVPTVTYEDRIKDNILTAVTRTKPRNKEEALKQLSLTMNIGNIMNHWNELEPVIAEKLNEIARREKWER